MLRPSDQLGTDDCPGVVRTPLKRLAVNLAHSRDVLRNTDMQPARTRLILAGMGLDDEAREGLVSMAEIIRSADGGSLRTFHGNLAHENGWYPSWKARRLQHWQGTAQFNMIELSECLFDVRSFQSETPRFRFHLGDRWREYTADLQTQHVDGTTTISEFKADARGLENEDYCWTLAAVEEICRLLGWKFEILLADEIFASRYHRDNVKLFASRRFVHIDPGHIRRLEDHAIRRGVDTTYGELASVLSPEWPAHGKAIIQGLLVRRRAELDLRPRLTDDTPVRIH